jgi:rhodanese-related sulfurtransferase
MFALKAQNFKEIRKMLRRSMFLLFMALVLLAACAPAPTATPVPTPVSPTKAPTAAPPAATLVPPTATPVPSTPVPTKVVMNEFAMIAEAADKFYSSGKPLIITAEKLYELLNDGDPANDPFLMNVCAAADAAKGTIKGSINIPRAMSFKPENLTKLPAKDKPIVTYCYTGTGAVGTAMVLNVMGYNAVQLKWGMMGWSLDDAPLGTSKRFPATQKDYPIDMKPVEATKIYAPLTVNTGKLSFNDILVALGDKWEALGKPVSLAADKVFEVLNDGDDKNDPFILDTRTAEDYGKGHIKGAVNIPAANVFKTANLAKLPTENQIIVTCYTGQTSGAVSYLLGLMGYNATTLQYGMMGWSKDDALIGAGNKRFPGEQKDYPIVKP